MFDYLTGDQEMPADLMEIQLQVALTLLHAGRVHDVIFLGSPIVSIQQSRGAPPQKRVAHKSRETPLLTRWHVSVAQSTSMWCRLICHLPWLSARGNGFRSIRTSHCCSDE